MCGAGWLLAAGWSLEGFRAGKRQKLLMWLDGCKMGLAVESEEGEVPHLRWSQAPPLPWLRPGSADIYIYIYIYSWDISMGYSRRKFRSETSDNMDSWKAEVRRVRREKIRRKKMQMRETLKVAIHCVFPMICGSGGSKSRLAEAAGAEPAGQTKDEKVHAVVARSTFWSENVQNTPGSDHFLKLRCRKSARRCGAKHISKSKCTKHTILGPLLEVAMSKKCTPLWREAHFQVKMYKTPHGRTTFGSSDVEKVHAVVARSTLPSQNVQNTPCSDHFLTLRCRNSVKKCTPLWREAHFEVKRVKNWGFWAFFEVQMSKK